MSLGDHSWNFQESHTLQIQDGPSHEFIHGFLEEHQKTTIINLFPAVAEQKS